MGAGMIIEYLSWSPDRATFVATMQALISPVTGQPLASVDDETGVLIPSEWVRIDEIGPVVKEPGVYDEDGNEITAPVMVEGWHVNLVAYGALAELLGTWDGILAYLGDMVEVASTVGEPEALAGTSGMKIYPPDVVDSPARVWA